MKARHMKHGGHKGHKKAGGGAAENPPVTDAYTGKDSEVYKSAHEKKHGGGLKMHEKHEVEGHKGKRRADHMKRKAGGRVGADKHPFTTAANTTEPKGTHEVRE